MIYQEKFNLNNSNAPYFSQQVDVLICGLRADSEKDDRYNHVKRSLNDFKGKVIYFSTDEDANSLNYEIKKDNGDIIDKQDGLSLIPDLRKFLKQNKVDANSICIDITCLAQPILFLLVKIFLAEIKPKKLFAAYTEPKKYKKNHHLITEDEEFELYEKIIGCNYSVPGFAKINREEKEMLIAPFGFERQRLISIFESVEPKGGLIPILGFPSFVPGWNLTALYMNYKVISDAESEQQIRFCEASSPFGLYRLLKELYDLYGSDYKLLIAPLGTRPHSLGAALFATKYRQCHLIYDFPVEKIFRSEDILKADIYNLTTYIE
jgi:hypothetical protein